MPLLPSRSIDNRFRPTPTPVPHVPRAAWQGMGDLALKVSGGDTPSAQACGAGVARLTTTSTSRPRGTAKTPAAMASTPHHCVWESGALTPVIGPSFDLSQASEALQLLDRREATGKVTLSF